MSTAPAVLVDVIVVFFAVRSALVLAGHPDEGLTHAVLPAVFGGSLAFAALGAGALAWYGEPFATLGSLLLYMYFLPLVFGAGRGVPLPYLLLGFAVMTVCTVGLRAVAAAVPKHRAPTRVKATDEHASADGRHRALLPQPQLGQLHRTAVRSAIGLGLGAFVMSAPGIVLTIAYLRRSYTLSVIGISTVAVLAYAQVQAPLGEALLYRGIDTMIGAAIAIALTLIIPVGRTPKPVWAG